LIIVAGPSLLVGCCLSNPMDNCADATRFLQGRTAASPDARLIRHFVDPKMTTNSVLGRCCTPDTSGSDTAECGTWLLSAVVSAGAQGKRKQDMQIFLDPSRQAEVNDTRSATYQSDGPGFPPNLPKAGAIPFSMAGLSPQSAHALQRVPNPVGRDNDNGFKPAGIRFKKDPAV
jgi:hypothetical protein